MGSTLNPGKISKAIADLRNAAIAEMDAPEKGVVDKGEVTFDVSHREQPNTEDPSLRAGAASYAGQNCPHIGNGPGGPQ